MTTSLPSTVLVIVGITGDLAKRKLLPAIQRIADAGELPQNFRIIGISRRAVSTQEIIESLPTIDETTYSFIKDHLEMRMMNLEDQNDYQSLDNDLSEIQSEWGDSLQKLFYLSVPPQMSKPIIERLGKAGFAEDKSMKLLMEKPFGSDSESAQELIDHTRTYFSEEQLYRIDHYLAKEMAQNIIVFRNGNSLFKRTWNNEFIEKIEITASEKITIEGRGVFYEQTGALRDVLQNHLMQLAALTLMELPEHDEWADIPQRRLKALQQLHIAREGNLDKHSYRAQYDDYQKEVENPGSSVETFVSVTLYSDHPAWKGVPVVLATGKALKDKFTEVRIHYKKQSDAEANQLSLRLQPKEGFEFDVWSKSPGYDRKLIPVQMRFNYKKQAEYLPEAYEQVFLDAIRSDQALFPSSDEVLEAWKIVQPLLHAWSMNDEPVPTYKRGSSIAAVMPSD